MAGIVEDNTEVSQYVEALFKKGVTVDHLRKLSEMPAIKIKSLLMML
jgi:N-dimethylarginine dimethylaminohydrolase